MLNMRNTGNKAQDITGKMNRNGVDYWICAIKFEEGEREAVEYCETAQNQLRITGRFI